MRIASQQAIQINADFQSHFHFLTDTRYIVFNYSISNPNGDIIVYHENRMTMYEVFIFHPNRGKAKDRIRVQLASFNHIRKKKNMD